MTRAIKAYAIFDGGGVLGAALAGCLKAAEIKGIKFVGFGGTSAGSIVATLGAVGMTGEEIEEAVVGTPFTHFLRDGGSPVARFKRVAAGAVTRVGGFRWHSPRRWVSAGWGAWQARTAARLVGPPLFGVDDGKTLTETLRRLILGHCKRVIDRRGPEAEHRRGWKDRPDITFDMLTPEAGCYPLKIVASDVTKRRPVEFSRERTEYGISVLGAVRASTCYPGVFRPYEYQQRRLVDGGLSSNLPASLFHREQRRTGLPVFAFDLVGTDEPAPYAYSFQDYLKDMVSTAIDAGDEFLRDILDQVYHIPVPIPRKFDPLDFEINLDGRQELFRIGFQHTTEYLEKHPVFRLLREARGAVRRELQVQFGEPALYEPVLAAVAADVGRASAAKNLRVTIMLPTGWGRRIVVYSHGMIRRRRDGELTHDPDADLEIAADAGVTGRAWRTGQPQVADVALSRQDPAAWGMTDDEYSKVPMDRRAMLSFPIPRLGVQDGDDPQSRFLGTLAIDSSTPLADTRWLAEGSPNELNAGVVERIDPWLGVIQRLLLFRR